MDHGKRSGASCFDRTEHLNNDRVISIARIVLFDEVEFRYISIVRKSNGGWNARSHQTRIQPP
jgi:hypothetical protein